MKHAAKLEFHSLAITDHGVMYGAIDFYEKARAAGIKPIIGFEAYIAPGSRFDKMANTRDRKDGYNHLLLLAENETGYHNLTKLTTAAHLEGFYYKPRIDKELLEEHKEGLIALSGCLASEIPQAITRGKEAEACEAIDWFKQVFGPERFYLELQNHGIAEQAKVNRKLIEWSKEFGLQLIATNDVHYVERDHSHAHDALICIGTQTHLSDTRRMSYVPKQFYLRSADEMAALFKEVPEAVRNTLAVAEQCNVQIELGKLHYPVFKPPEIYTREGYLRHLVAEAMYTRYGVRCETKGDEFILHSIEDANRLPTFEPTSDTDTSDKDSPAIAKALHKIIDRLQAI